MQPYPRKRSHLFSLICSLAFYPLLGSREKEEKEIGKKENGEIFKFFFAWMEEENRREGKFWWWDPQIFFLPSTGEKTDLIG